MAAAPAQPDSIRRAVIVGSGTRGQLSQFHNYIRAGLGSCVTERRSQAMKTIHAILKAVFGLFFVAAGVNHFLATGFYLRMMPAYVPWHVELVYLSGHAEIALGILVLIPTTSRLAAWGLIALLIAVFPANLQMALHPDTFPEFSATGLWGRLPLQAVLVAWAYRYTRTNTATVAV